MEFIERWGYAAVGYILFSWFIVHVIATTRRDPKTGRYRVTSLLLGSMAPYVERRGGLTRREVLGGGIVLAVVTFIVVGSLVTLLMREFGR